MSWNVNRTLKMKQNKAGQKASTNQVSQDPGPSCLSVPGVDKTRWVSKICVHQSSFLSQQRNIKERDEKLIEIIRFLI